MRTFDGYFINGDGKEANEALHTDNIESGTLRGEYGRRVLIMQGTDYGGQFELVAREREPNVFKGTWQYGKNDYPEEVELRIYGDPEGEFVLIGHYLYEGTKYRWAFELAPSED